MPELRGTTRIFICPICPLHRPGWLKHWTRNDHMRHNHPGIPYPKGKDPSVPDGDGRAEWWQHHEEDPYNPLPLDGIKEKLPTFPPHRGRGL